MDIAISPGKKRTLVRLKYKEDIESFTFLKTLLYLTLFRF